MTYVSKRTQIQSCPRMARLLRGTTVDDKITRYTNVLKSIRFTLPLCVEVIQLLSRQLIRGPVVALAHAKLVGLVHVFQRRILEFDTSLKSFPDSIRYRFPDIKSLSLCCYICETCKLSRGECSGGRGALDICKMDQVKVNQCWLVNLKLPLR